MRKHALLLITTFVALAMFAGFSGWSFYADHRQSADWRDLQALWPFVFGGVSALAILTAALAWLSFHAKHRGPVDRAGDPASPRSMPHASHARTARRPPR